MGFFFVLDLIEDVKFYYKINFWCILLNFKVRICKNESILNLFLDL